MAVCVYCGSFELSKNFDYDTAHTHYECEDCGGTFTEQDLRFCDICGKQILKGEEHYNEDNFLVCSHCR